MPALTAAESPCSQPPWSVWETLLSGSHLLPLTLTGFLPSPMTILDSREGCDTGVPFWGKHFLLCDIFRGRERSGGGWGMAAAGRSNLAGYIFIACRK